MTSTVDHHIPASAALDALRAAGCDHVVTVPDWVQLAMHVRLEAGEPGLPMVACCAEDQAVTVAAGLTLGGRRPVVVVQNQGEDIDHLAITAGLAQHFLLQFREGNR